MNTKILSVDDSKAVRIIIKKSFKAYDVNIVEAANGVEGLAAAAKEKPDLILLDVTMPVMGGIDMLTKLKADPNLKSIPVMMLTAEAGKEIVMKIAKIGIRDYIIKPFKENVLVEKASRIVEIKPKESIASSTDAASSGSVQPIGNECFISEEDALLLRLTGSVGDDLIKGVSELIPGKISEAVDNGIYRVIIDLNQLSAVDEKLVNVLNTTIQNCQELTLSHIIVANDETAQQCMQFAVAKEWIFTKSLDEAKVS